MASLKARIAKLGDLQYKNIELEQRLKKKNEKNNRKENSK